MARQFKIKSGRPSFIRGAFGGIAVIANLFLGLYLCALGGLGLIVGGEMFFPLVPVSPEAAAVALLLLGLFAVVASALAISDGRLKRIPLLVWAAALFSGLTAAVFRGDYRFDGIESFKAHGWMLLGSFLLLCASWVRYKTPSRKRSLY
ncbi:MAG: hypothetical protein OXJ37_10435 [Bryobacterales bacterium]|nr:hypothetical protein [Bryobacterales bacterium]MDE0262805.1 hypothetical protein [Bryobacterales bacterium]MDE0622624.1 hypothetical protein [Bryobacterales bacterium]